MKKNDTYRTILLALTLSFLTLWVMLPDAAGQTNINIGSGTSTQQATTPVMNNIAIAPYYYRVQLIYTAAQITSAGWVSGNGYVITQIGWKFKTLNSASIPLNNYTIRMANANPTTYPNYTVEFPAASLTTVKNAFTYTPSCPADPTYDMIALDNSFTWDGSSNVVIDVCYQSTATATRPTLYGFNGGIRSVSNSLSSRCSSTMGSTSSGSSAQTQVRLVFTTGAACSAPTTQANNITATPAALSASINWTNGNGGGRVVYVNTTNSFTAPVDGSNPTASTSYISGQQCVFNGTGSGPVNVTGLTQGTTYYVRVYEFCTPTRNYNTSTATSNPNSFVTTTPCTAPSTQASSITAGSITSNSASINWTNGNGAGRVVYVNSVNSFTPPGNGTSPTANPAYTSGQQCVFNGTGSGPVSITGLTGATTYYVMVYEFCNPDRLYNTTTATNNPGSFLTTPSYCTPSYSIACNFAYIDNISVANLTQTATGCSGALADYTGTTVSFTQGSTYPFTITTSYLGSDYFAWWIDFNNDGDFQDANEFLGNYTASSNTVTGSITIPAGATTGNHRMRVRGGYSSSFTSTMECTNQTYGETHDYTANIVASGSCTAPSTQASSITAGSITVNSASINWTNGNGAGRVVYVNAINSFTPPSNGASPTANTTYAGGQQCVFNGTGSGPVTVTGLSAGTTYYVMVYEFCNPDRNYNTGTATNNPSSFATTPNATSIALADNGTQVGIANVNGGTINHVLHKIQLSVTNADATLTAISFTMAGTYQAADISSINVWYQTSSTFGPTQSSVASASSLGPGVKNVTLTFPPTITAGTTGYIFITADVKTCATSGRTISVNAITPSNLTFISGTATGSATAGGVQTITSPSGYYTLDYLNACNAYSTSAFPFNAGGSIWKYNESGTIYVRGGNNGLPACMPACNITEISFATEKLCSNNTVARTLNGNVKIWMKNTSDASYTGTIDIATQRSTMTKVFDGTVNISLSSDGFVKFTGLSGFIYDGTSNLEVSIEFCGLTTFSVSGSWASSSISNSSYAAFSNSTCATSTTPNSYRAITRFTTLPVCSAPSTQASNITAGSVTASTASINWTNGNGGGRVVFINTTNSFTAPVIGSNPTANTTYSGGQQCIFNGTGSGPVTVSGLTAGTTYYVRVYEYCTPDRVYNITTATNNPFSFTCSIPAQPGTISGITFVCPNQTGVTYSIVSVPGATSYTWSVPTGASITGGQGSTGITVDFGANQGDISVYASNACGNSNASIASISMNSISGDPTGISGVTSICSGNSTTLSVLGGSLGTGASWKWYSGSCGGTPAGSGVSISTSPSVNTDYYVRAEGTCNMTLCVTVTITVDALSIAPSGINASVNPLCAGSSTDLTISGGSLGTGASWKWYSGSCGGIPEGSGISISPSPSVNTDYYVRAEGTCNTSNCASVLITVNSCAMDWTGNVDSNWNNPSNWSAGVIPGGGTDVTIPAGRPHQPDIFVSAQCNSLTIANGAIVTIRPQYSLTTRGTTILNGANCLVIKSDAAGTGSFIDNGAITGVGTAKVERYITANIWHYISKPVATASASIFNGSYLKKWIESNYSWLNITSPSTALTTMDGYALKSLTTKTFSFAAKPYTGAFSKPVTRNSSQPTSKRGWNLVGNPYPSSIDWMAVTGWTKTNVDNSIYVYNDNYANYAVYNGGTQLGVNGGSRYIAAEQGFFVTCNNSAGGTLGLNNSVRIHNNTPFLKSLSNENYVRLTLKHSDSNDEIIILINPLATSGFDGNLDAYKIIAPEIDQIWSMNYTDLTKQYSINSIADVQNNPDIPVAFAPTENGMYNLSASEFDGLKQQTGIYLEDLKTEIITDLIENPSYSFAASTSDDINRFVLHFIKPEASGITTVDGNNGLSLYPNPNNGKFIISLTDELEGNATINIYDVLGHCIISKEVNGLVREEFTCRTLSPGVYYLKVSGEREIPVVRFIVYQ